MNCTEEAAARVLTVTIGYGVLFALGFIACAFVGWVISGYVKGMSKE